MRTVVLTLALAGCTAPNFGSGHLRCATTGNACPHGFYCAGDDRCWLAGSGPDLGLGGDDLGDVADLSSSDLASATFDLSSRTQSLCRNLNVLLCDGFEKPSFDGVWTVSNNSNGSFTVDNTRAYRGNRSAHVHTNAYPPAPVPDQTLTEMRTFPLSTGTIYLRAWVYMQSPLPSNSAIAFFILADNGSGGVEVDSIAGGHPGLNGDATPMTFATSTSLFPLDRWACLQLSMPQGVANGPVHLYLDGKEVTDAALANATITQVVALYMGLEFDNPPSLTPIDVWYDELIVDNKPTTCDE